MEEQMNFMLKLQFIRKVPRRIGWYTGILKVSLVRRPRSGRRTSETLHRIRRESAFAVVNVARCAKRRARAWRSRALVAVPAALTVLAVQAVLAVLAVQAVLAVLDVHHAVAVFYAVAVLAELALLAVLAVLAMLAVLTWDTGTNEFHAYVAIS